MPRFYCPQPLTIGAAIELPPPVAHHLLVLRTAIGSRITLFNGTGGEYTAILTALDRKRGMADIKTFSPREAELPYAVKLVQGLPEAAKMDWIIEKAVELGAAAIQPLAAQRSVVRLSAERAERKMAHWQAIVIAAAEQSGRNRLAHLAEPLSFGDWAAQRDLHLRVLLSPRAERSLSEWARHHPPQPLSLAVGPEGGFTTAEEDSAAANGVLLLSIGARVLRTETAGLAALAALNALWGEM